MSELLFPDLSYKIVGYLFEVHNRLGGKFEEKYYQRAMEQLLRRDNLSYKRELKANIYFENEKIGKYFLDFLIDDRIVLELKTVPMLLPMHFKQVRSYFKSKKIRARDISQFSR